MTMAASQRNDATSTAEAAAVGQRTLWQQWWWQKQWDNNDGDDRQQRLQCGPGIMSSSNTATGATLTITATAATDRMMKIITMTFYGGGGHGGVDIGLVESPFQHTCL
jgi:hypothetical protein